MQYTDLKDTHKPLLNTGVPMHSVAASNVEALGTPIFGDDAPAPLRQKFVTQGWKDVPAAVLFLLTLFATVGIAGYHAKTVTFFQCSNAAFVDGSGSGTDGTGGLFANSCQLVQKLAIFGGIGVGSAFVLCTLALIVMHQAPVVYIYMANIVLIAIYAGLAGYEFSQHLTYSGVVLSVLAVIYALWFYLVRRRIPFAAALLSQSVRTVTKHWGSMLMALVGLVVMVAYTVAWFVAFLPFLIKIYNTSTSSAAPFGATCGFLLLFYWSTQVMINVVHVTASGTVATWYFAGRENMPSNPSAASARRAMTTSFGSICFGSFLVAMLKLIHAILRSSMRQRSFLACIAMCLIVLIERLMEWFNVYAFTHVAIYGSSYITAAKQTWAMIKDFGWAAIFNDNLVFPVLTVTSLFDSALVGVIVFEVEGRSLDAALLGCAAFATSYVIHIVLLRVVYSGVVTIFVCYVECPEALEASNPEFNAKVDAAIEPLRRTAAATRV